MSIEIVRQILYKKARVIIELKETIKKNQSQILTLKLELEAIKSRVEGRNTDYVHLSERNAGETGTVLAAECLTDQHLKHAEAVFENVNFVDIQPMSQHSKKRKRGTGV